ncbi:hypothetical protein ACXR5E_002000 [Vibrio mimicus]|uniref:hypothetical protein n=1 Tax=Vibrio mimicus TaxID=674 RepID=UPI0002D4623C|nr:hypothetical protein [Vibrio mimicus]
MKLKPLAIFFAVATLSSHAVANQAILVPTDSAPHESSTFNVGSQSTSNTFNLAVDDLSNRVKTVVIPEHPSIKPELVAELTEVGIQQGFTVLTQSPMYLWTEDNMWLSRDSAKVFRPTKSFGNSKSEFQDFIVGLDKTSPLAILEGHHSNNSIDTQGLDDSMYSLADSYAERSGAELVKTFSIIDGGNMLVGHREDGSQYVLVGRDSVLQTALLYTRYENERVEAKKQQMEKTGGFTLSIAKLKIHNIELDNYIQSNNDPEIDRMMLEALGLLPFNLDSLEKQMEYAKLVRAKYKLLPFSQDESNIIIDESKLNTVREKIKSRYEELLGGPLPKEFDWENELKKAYKNLTYAANHTSDFDLSLIDDKVRTMASDPILQKHYVPMLEAGGQMRKGLPDSEARAIAKRFIAMTEIVEEKMAEELGVTRDNLIILTQPGFHIDMQLRPLENGKVLINDYEHNKAIVKSAANNPSITEDERVELQNALTELDNQAKYYNEIHKKIRQQLTEAGLTPVRTAGAFHVGEKNVNWMNGIMGTGNSKFYITNASSVSVLNDAFQQWIQHTVPGISVYFVGKEASSDIFRRNLNQAEALLFAQGGLDCVTIHFE